MFYAVVQLIGTKKEAENFIYKLAKQKNKIILIQVGTLQQQTSTLLGSKSTK